jgi:hypothetical protein
MTHNALTHWRAKGLAADLVPIAALSPPLPQNSLQIHAEAEVDPWMSRDTAASEPTTLFA